MHGLLVAGPEFRILNIRTNKYVNALSFLLDENVRRDQGCERNLFIWRDPERFGPIVVDRWKTWEDHSDQVFFVLSEARVSLHTPIADGGGSVRATVGDLYRSVLKRRAWDLYADPTFAIGGIANFQASADSSSSASLSVLHSLILQSLSNKSSSYTCYGTHYRYALSVSLKTGVLDSDQRLKTAVQRRLEEDAVRLTNDLDAEGIVITEAEKRGIVAEYDRKTDLFEMVYLNGHCLEWLCHFLPGRGLVDQPITRAIDRLAEDLAAACQGQFQDYGALCHAAHALQMFEEKTRELLPEEQ